VGVETLAHTMGWWHYPRIETPYGPLLMYPAAILIIAVLALIGWRVTRRFGWRGQATFLIALAIVGPLRDYGWASRSSEIIVFAPGIGPVLVDAACWAGLVGLGKVVMRLVAGPVKSDALARQSDRPTDPNGNDMMIAQRSSARVS
jgi:hypothetical protein